jgi:hypothetical protein
MSIAKKDSILFFFSSYRSLLAIRFKNPFLKRILLGIGKKILRPRGDVNRRAKDDTQRIVWAKALPHKLGKDGGGPNQFHDNQPIRLPGLKPGVCSGLILSGAYYPNLKIGVLRRERIKYRYYTPGLI